MYIILIGNGKKLYGRTWEGLVNALKGSTYFEQSIKIYMKDTAKRARILGQEIEHANPETFLKELERIGIIKIQRGRRTKWRTK